MVIVFKASRFVFVSPHQAFGNGFLQIDVNQTVDPALLKNGFNR